MKINKVFSAGLIVGAVLFGATNVFAQFAQPYAPQPPPPPGVMLAPGTAVCPRCQGYRRVPSGFLGLKDKRCPECRGTGVVMLRGHHHAPPPPPKAHHRKPAPPPPPKAKYGPGHGKKGHHVKGPGKGPGGPKKPGRR